MIKNRINNEKLIHQSDRVFQYFSVYYHPIFKQNQIKQSFSAGYDCYQNALTERIYENIQIKKINPENEKYQ